MILALKRINSRGYLWLYFPFENDGPVCNVVPVIIIMFSWPRINAFFQIISISFSLLSQAYQIYLLQYRFSKGNDDYYEYTKRKPPFLHQTPENLVIRTYLLVQTDAQGRLAQTPRCLMDQTKISSSQTTLPLEGQTLQIDST